MEKGCVGNFSSPIIHKNSVKRFGLSRKRKSCGNESSSDSKIQALDGNSPESTSRSQNCAPEQETVTAAEVIEKVIAQDCHSEKETVASSNVTERVDTSGKNHNDEVQSLKNKIAEMEEKLKSFPNAKKISELKELIETWRSGCKKALLHLLELLKEKQTEKVDVKAVLLKLGIWEVMIEKFGDDEELCLSDYNN